MVDGKGGRIKENEDGRRSCKRRRRWGVIINFIIDLWDEVHHNIWLGRLSR